MSSLATVTLSDEINAKITGVSLVHLREVIKKIAVMTPNGRHTAAYQIKAWDGKEAQLNEQGETFQYMLPQILPIMEKQGYLFELVDKRKPRTAPTPPKIDDTFLDEFGIGLRYYQVNAVNNVIDIDKGILDICTSGGKTFICGAIIKAYYDAGQIPSITIVPSILLVKQTLKTYKSIGLDAGGILKGDSKDWNKPHIICTWQTLNKNLNKIPAGFNGVLLYDEAHVMGDSMYHAFSTAFRDCYIRVGLTGSVPKHKWKAQKLYCHIGSEVMIEVKPEELQKSGHISTCDIEMIPIIHELELALPEEYSWDLEFAYMVNNPSRIELLLEYINDLGNDTKRLILTHPQLAKKLAEGMGFDYIIDDTSTSDRSAYLKKFTHDEPYTLIASFNTIGTGISIDEIKHIVLIDAGKNYTRVVQSIGRGLRLDGTDNHLKVTDIYAKLLRKSALKKDKMIDYSFSGTKHLSERLKIYKELKYPYKELKPLIVQ